MDMNIFIDENGIYDEKKAFAARLEYLNSNHADEMSELKANYTFHSLKFSDDMDRWFDLWRKPKSKQDKNMSLKDFKLADIPRDEAKAKDWLKSELDKFVTTLRTSAFNIDEYEAFLKEVSSDIIDKTLNKKEKKPSDDLACGNKEYFLDCLADPWIYMSISSFIDDVSSHGIISSDGCCSGVAVDKKTLQLREIDINLSDFDFSYRDKENKIGWDEKVNQLVKKYSTDEYQFIGVEWFNK